MPARVAVRVPRRAASTARPSTRAASTQHDQPAPSTPRDRPAPSTPRDQPTSSTPRDRSAPRPLRQGVWDQIVSRPTIILSQPACNFRQEAFREMQRREQVQFQIFVAVRIMEERRMEERRMEERRMEERRRSDYQQQSAWERLSHWAGHVAS
ncbi:hypothetical protein FDECE_4262 [Fusarium decemcellulare]|nr:hypothetical protein FDECE_4262 [Fusarium decemcellulare]